MTAKAPVCGFTLDGVTCRRRGAHRCGPRAAHVVGFFSEVLVHTKGVWARRPFVPARWQRMKVLEPLFGEVVWSGEFGRYVRRYQTLYLCVARKNGKTDLIAGIMLYLLCADGEEQAELYGLALDRDQASLAYDVMARMAELSPVLRARLKVARAHKRLTDPRSSSVFVVAAGDDEGALGFNPHGAYIDELLTQPDRDLYDAVKTGMGTRAQPLLLLATTAESDPHGFGASERRWSEKVAADPSLDPRRLVVIYVADRAADWRRVSTWRQANPALGDFLSIETLRAECKAAQHNPAAQRAFRQFRLNQPQGGTGVRPITLEMWDRLPRVQVAEPGVEVELAGARAWGGLDLASTQDLASACYVLAPAGEREWPLLVWRHWCPSERLADLSRRTAGMAEVWARDGWLSVTEGNVIDFAFIRAQLNADADLFDVQDVAYDRWGATELSQDLTGDGFSLVEFGQGYASMAAPTKELLRVVAGGQVATLGDPVARWEASNVVMRSDPAGNLKPDKERSDDKIDGYVAATMGWARWMFGRGRRRRSAYATRDMVVI